MSFQTCDLCDQFSGLLVDYYGRWTCLECMNSYGLEQVDSSAWMVVCKPTRTHVTIEEIDCDEENLGLNTRSINYSPNWNKHKFGPCKVSVEFLDGGF